MSEPINNNPPQPGATPPLPWDQPAPLTAPRKEKVMPFPVGIAYDAYSLGGSKFVHGVFIDAHLDVGLNFPAYEMLPFHDSLKTFPIQFLPNIRGVFGPEIQSVGGGMNIFAGLFDQLGLYLNTTLNYVHMADDDHGTLNLDFGLQLVITPGLQGFLEIGGPVWQFENEVEYNLPHNYKLGVRAQF